MSENLVSLHIILFVSVCISLCVHVYIHELLAVFMLARLHETSLWLITWLQVALIVFVPSSSSSLRLCELN